jgi:hypothetical protein
MTKTTAVKLNRIAETIDDRIFSPTRLTAGVCGLGYKIYGFLLTVTEQEGEILVRYEFKSSIVYLII